MEEKDEVGIEDLLELMRRLRSKEGGCPWDLEQTARSLTPYIIEEAYEVVEAIEGGRAEDVCEELGDLLFQIIFQARVFEEAGEFGFGEVLRGIYNKMVVRHPHVFGEALAETSEDVRRNWVKIKQETKGKKEGSALGDVPRGLPGLLRGRRLTENAAQVGFDWRETGECLAKVEEELGELKAAIAGGEQDEIEHELGDMLFALVNLSRFVKVNPEVALGGAIARFVERFSYIERTIRASGRGLEESDLEEMDRLWEEAKQRDKAGG